MVAVLVAGAAVLAGCSSGDGQAGEALQVARSLVAPTPAAAPPAKATPAGTVHPLARQVTAMTVDQASRTLAVAVRQPDELLLFGLDDLAGTPRAVALPGAVDQLTPTGAGSELFAPVPSADQLLRIKLPGGEVDRVPVSGQPTGAVTVGDRTVVTTPGTRGVTILRGGHEERRVEGLQGAAVPLLSDSRVLVVDRLHTSVTPVDLDKGTLGAALRAGDGASNAVVDRFGRAFVVDTRGGELMAFTESPNQPLLMRLRYPVPGAPWGIAYDGRRDLLWITLTEKNELVGYDVSGAEPVERHRVPTVHQPNAVAVDQESGRVLVASADSGGVQVVQP
ncbi:YncE family protein [Streptoalloteichus tenebrarius]|uniref:YncE family protein n=1 Tax=Streptoalloteichus tenebrarius (strain ATCC 17920 / DSM 40477 / JCM 4838 / CBS 697.72 / NBRC 16177 / NCIMB 11028 / NRRL B-12390 / A12253. 1 / ISP 5477) TaxID=1933 RepID=UPI0020A610BD|nr:hypothetical protein [Streptoalloteichus tenebrarius]